MSPKRRRKRSYEELEVENRYLKRYNPAQGFWGSVSTLYVMAGLVAISVFVFLSVQSLAGKETKAQILLDLLGDLRFSAPVLFGCGGVAYGWRERKLRKDTVQRLQGRITSLESQLDPGRSSSQLTDRGETSPRDR